MSPVTPTENFVNGVAVSDVYKRQILKTSELITCEKQGQYVIYAINTSAVEQMYCRFLDVFDGMAFHGKAQKHEK